MRIVFCAIAAALVASGARAPDDQRHTSMLPYEGSYVSTLYEAKVRESWDTAAADVGIDLAGNVYFHVPQHLGVYRLAKATGAIEQIVSENPPFSPIQGMAVDPTGTYLYLARRGAGVSRVDVATHAIVTIDGTLDAYGIAIHPTTGLLYVGQNTPANVVRLAPSGGAITTVAGNGTHGYSGDGGPATAAMLDTPWEFAFDAAGNLYISDSHANRVRKVDAATGIITTIAGRNWPGYWGDGGPAVDAPLYLPRGLAVDASGHVYIADSYNCRVRRIDAATGLIDTFVGGAGCGHDGDGGPPVPARVGLPWGLAFDASGNLYITETWDFRLRKVTIRADDVPLVGDLDGDHKADLVLWHPSTGVWSWLTSSSAYSTASAVTRSWTGASPGDVPLLADIDGDGTMDLVFWQKATGTWSWITSSSGFDVTSATSLAFGDASQNDVPVPGDIDGDGKADLVVWRAMNGTWYWRLSSVAFAPASEGSRQWGQQFYDDVPMRADMDGDGRMDLTVWRAQTGMWYWLRSSTAYDYASASLRQWGSQYWSDLPLAGDLDGDRKSDPLVWRRMTGQWFWLRSLDDHDYATAQGRTWGAVASGDTPLTGDIDGDGIADMIRWRAATGTWYWLTAASGHMYSSAQSKQWGSTR